MSVTSYPCPNGHISIDEDYCSECGKKLSGAVTVTATTGASDASGKEACPDCGTPRASATAVFCEVCRYNFSTKQSWSPEATLTSSPPPATSFTVASAVPVVARAVVAPVPPSPTVPVPSPPAVSPGVPVRWEAVVTVDPTLYADPDPANPVPVGTPERIFPLDFPENLLGRRSERRAIYPEIDLSGDSGVSSRHAILYREADGGVTLLDVGSTNGTQINGSEVVPGVRMPLGVGDQITVGCWTRITLRAAGEKP